MSRKRSTLDEKPEAIPDIRSDGHNLTCALPLNDVEEGLRLVAEPPGRR